MSLNSLSTINDYLTTYGELLGRKAVENLDPLYDPNRHESLDMSVFSRPPKPAQAHLINAAVRAWENTRSLIICGEMGTGKSLIGAAAIHAAMLAAGKPNYRALIMAPGTLTEKWKEELEMTIPGIKVILFERSKKSGADDSYKEVLRYAASCKSSDPHRWSKPLCPEWVIVGKDQAKHDPGWKSIATTKRRHNPGIFRNLVVGMENVVNDRGFQVYDKQGNPRKKLITAEGMICPTCGNAVRTKTGLLMSPEAMADSDESIDCEGTYLQEVWHEKRGPEAYDRISPIPVSHRAHGAKVGSRFVEDGRQYEVRKCGEALWNWTPTPRKWAPARIIQRRCKNLFDFFVLDEMHQTKEAETGQGLASGKLMGSAKRVIGLTGTLIGGFSHHLLALLFRMAPRTLIEDGFAWKGEDDFAKAYGRVDRIITTKYGEERTKIRRRRGATSMAGDGKSTTRDVIKPGVMPTLFGRHLLDKALFIDLLRMEGELPPIVDDDRSLIAVPMGAELAEEYKRIQKELVAENTMLIRKGNMKLMSTMLHTLLEYPDRPFGYSPPAGCHDEDSVGWWLDAKNKRPKDYRGVVSPANLDETRIHAKEQALLNLISKEKAEGRQVWLYCEMTGERDIQERLAGMIRKLGLTVKILRDDTVKPEKRISWIRKNAPGTDVVISNPRLVAVGIDFFDKAKTFNFPTIIFYQPSYDINTTRQAGRRHWRIGQTKECRTYYMYYTGSMQHRAVVHCGDKLAAAKQLEGKFSAEGLAALATGTSAMSEMAKALSEKIVDPRASWAKLRPAAKARVAKAIADDSIAALSTVPSLAPEYADMAKAIAQSIVLSDAQIAALFDDEPTTTVEVSDSMLIDFQKALERLGMSIDDID